MKKIGDEYFMYLIKCKDPKACTVLLRGGSKDVLQEVDRNLQDAMAVARNVLIDPRVLPGGGATEMYLSALLESKSRSVEGEMQQMYKQVGTALEVIPRTLSENCGGKTIRLITELRARHTEYLAKQGEGEGEEGKKRTLCTWGIDGTEGEVANVLDLNSLGNNSNKGNTTTTTTNGVTTTTPTPEVEGKKQGVFESYLVKTQTYKTAVEAACLLLRIDAILSGMRSEASQREDAKNKAKDEEDDETFGDARDG